MRVPCAALVFLLFGAASAQAQRLPGTVMPRHYDITVTPRLAEAKFSGTVGIDLDLAAASNTIVLNAAEITFLDVAVTSAGVRQAAAVTLDTATEQATFTFAKPVPAGAARLDIRYDGILNDDLRGLYLSKANNRRYAVTQLEATDARRMFPSFDEPAYKATFALTAIIDRGDHAISNGAVVSDTPGPGPAQHTVTFETSPRMSTYLVALAVGDFECSSGSADGIPIRICSTPDKKGLTAFALEASQQIVRYLNGYYSVPYPFKKLDIVAVPDFAAGAMENTAAIFYRETLLLAQPGASVRVRKNIAEVLAHEIAHQWFGNLVTMQWWDDLWLNEGFANWMMSKPVKDWRPDWAMELDEVEDNHLAMGLDALRSTRPVRSKANTPAEINELFDPIAYEKGAAVLRMVEAWIGPDAFRRGVNAYIEKFRYANARAEDFWGTLTAVTGKPVDTVMASFVDQPGLPLVNVALRCADGESRAELSQERYLGERAAAAAAAPPQVWQIPVCLRSSAGAVSCELLRERQQTVALDTCPAWLMGNASARGYYRAAIDPGMVRTMAERVEMLSAAERMVVLSDEWALVRSGRHDVSTFMDLAAGFGGERTSAVVGALGEALRGVENEFTTDATRPAFRRWVAQLVAPALRDVGTRAAPGDDDERKALRAAVVWIAGAIGRDAEVLAAMRQLVREDLRTAGSVEPTLLAVAVQLAAIDADVALFEQYAARSHAATNPEERYRYLYALTAFTDPALTGRVMEVTLSPQVRGQDAKNVLARMLRNPDTRRVAWHLVRERWPEIQKKTGEFVGNTVIVGALGDFCDTAVAGEIAAFFEAHPLPEAARTIQQTVESVSACGAAAAGQQPKLAQWLAERVRP